LLFFNISVVIKDWFHRPIKCVVLLLITWLCSAIAIYGDEYQFRHFSSSEGLSDNQLSCVFVDSRGLIWAGTTSGLNRFDGYRFHPVNYTTADSVKSVSLNRIQFIYEDHQGILWLRLFDNSCVFYNPKTEVLSKDHEVFHQNEHMNYYGISGVVVDRDSNLWLSSNRDGVYQYQPKQKRVIRLKVGNGNDDLLQSNVITGMVLNSAGDLVTVNANGFLEVIDARRMRVKQRVKLNIEGGVTNYYSLFIDKDDDCWIAARDSRGLFYYSFRSQAQRHLTEGSTPTSLSTNLVNSVVQDRQGTIWVGTDHGGICLISKTNFTVHVIKKQEGNTTGLSHNNVTTLGVDHSGGIWAGTHKGGINYYHPSLYQFGLMQRNPFDNNALPVGDVNCFAEDNQGNIWIGTNEDGVLKYDRKTAQFTHYQHQPGNPNSLSSNVIVSMLCDSKNQLWIGTYQGGLNRFDGKGFVHYFNIPADDKSLSGNNIWAILEDSRKRLWIGVMGGGLDLYDENSNGFWHYREGDVNSIRSNYVNTIYESGDGNIWVGTSEGTDVLDAATNRFNSIESMFGNKLAMSNGTVMAFLEDRQGRMWIATNDGLNCVDVKRQTNRVFRMEDGLPDNVVVALQLDRQGQLWLSTHKGLSNLEIKGGDDLSKATFTFHNYVKSDGLQDDVFNSGASLLSSRGELIFGGLNGFNLFDPQDIKIDHLQSHAFITDFRIQNNRVLVNKPFDDDVILNQAIDFTKEIELTHRQNIFSIQFSSTNYVYPEKVKFRYRLEGINNDWIEADAANRTAAYSNLDAGTYLFRLKASGSDGRWDGPETVLKITIIPPFYASKIAFLIYFLLLAALLVVLIKVATMREQWKYRRMQEKAEHERLLELENMKTKFYTNVSHELRTPLTLILSPLDRIIHQTTNKEHQQQLKLVQRNGKRLLNLVNQLLDFRRIEANGPLLNLSFGDIVLFIKELCDSFVEFSESKGIALRFETTVKHYEAYFDQNKMERIIFNLLSNAFKFTPPNGTVSLSVRHCNQPGQVNFSMFKGHEYLEIKVTDTGIGVKPADLPHLFDRYFQGENAIDQGNQGSGIGLSIAREFTQIHQGTIDVESVESQGSTFTVRIPFRLKEEKSGDFVEVYELKGLTNDDSDDLEDDAAESAVSHSKPTILIVDDNPDLRFYLRTSFKGQYNILEAENGEEGWRKTIENQPSIVVCDVMMPVLDGLQLCRMIKHDSSTSHIPVILLTARTTNDQKVEGLEAGADDYITKPFNFEILELRITKLIENRRALQQRISQKFEVSPGEIGITSLDEQFMQKALKLVEANIPNPDFSVEEMSHHLGMSRSHLYNKIVALTGKSPAEFIRVMRIKRAAQLLEKSQLYVSTIAYEVGFNSTKYFVKHFKDEYGMSPSEYAKMHSKK